VLLLAACSTAGDSALSAAADDARRQVPGLADAFAQQLRAAPDTDAGITSMAAWIPQYAGPPGGSGWVFVVDTSLASDPHLTLAVYGHGNGTRKGNPLAQAWVELCVRLEGQAGPLPGVTTTQVTCPSNTPAGAPPVVDRVLTPP